jgi:hypothetical protein
MYTGAVLTRTFYAQRIVADDVDDFNPTWYIQCMGAFDSDTVKVLTGFRADFNRIGQNLLVRLDDANANSKRTNELLATANLHLSQLEEAVSLLNADVHESMTAIKQRLEALDDKQGRLLRLVKAVFWRFHVPGPVSIRIT